MENFSAFLKVPLEHFETPSPVFEENVGLFISMPKLLIPKACGAIQFTKKPNQTTVKKLPFCLIKKKGGGFCAKLGTLWKYDRHLKYINS